MKTLKQFGIILVILFVGQVLQLRYSLPIPSTVLGMVILLALLITKIIKIDKVDKITSILLDNLTLFFVPAGVGIITMFENIKEIWWPLLIIIFISTIVVMVVTGLTVQILNKNILKKHRKGV